MRPTRKSGSTVLMRALRRRLGLLLPGTASLSLWQVCEALVPVAIGVVVDVAIIPRSLPMLGASIAGIALLFIVLSYGYRFGARLCNAAREHEAHALRVEVAHVSMTAEELPSDRASGEVLSIASADADLAAEVFGHLGRGVAAVLGMVVAAVLLLLADPVTGLIVLIAVPVGLAVVSLPSRSVSRKATLQLEATAHASNSAADLMRGLRVLNALGGADWAHRRFRITSDRAADAGVATGERSGRLSGLGALVMSVVLAIVLVVAGLRLIDGQVSVGALIAILGMTAFLTEPMRALADIVGLTARSHGAAVRIADLLNSLDPAAEASVPTQPHAPASIQQQPSGRAQPKRASAPPYVPALTQPRAPAPSEPEVTLTDERLAVRGRIAFEAPMGMLVAVVCERDAAAFDLLTALSAHARELGPERLLVPPHAVDLFEGTIRTNITMAPATDTALAPAGTTEPAPDTDTDKARAEGEVSVEVLAASGADELLGLVTDGLDHRIQELGGNLSGGQRQRIGLARALQARPTALVLHEPTTAVDAVTEVRIAQSITEVRRGAVTVILTGSPAFLATADRVVFVPADGGAIVSTHTELLTADTPAARRYREAVTR